MNQDIPTLDRYGKLTFADGSVFLAPVISSELESTEERDKDWQQFESKIEHPCKSGSCQHAHNVKCRCRCKGKSHRSANQHSLTEYLPSQEEMDELCYDGDETPSPHMGIYL